jgi:hypothetical protein
MKLTSIIFPPKSTDILTESVRETFVLNRLMLRKKWAHFLALLPLSQLSFIHSIIALGPRQPVEMSTPYRPLLRRVERFCRSWDISLRASKFRNSSSSNKCLKNRYLNFESSSWRVNSDDNQSSLFICIFLIGCLLILILVQL